MSFRFKQSVRSLRLVTVPALAGLVALGLAACGDDSTGPDVSQQQAEEVAAAVSSAIGATFSITLSGGSAASLAPGALTPTPRSLQEMPTAAETNSYTFDNSTSCPQGGSVSASGDGTVTSTSTASSTTIDWDWNAQADYDNCGVQADQDANIFFLSTPSPIDFTGNGTITSQDSGGGNGSFTWNYGGTFDWDEQGGSSGSCDVDLTTSLDIQGTDSTIEWTGSISGTVCGQSINRTFDTTISI